MLYHYLNKSIRKLDTLSYKLNHRNWLHDNKDMILLKLEFLVAHATERVAFKSKEQELLTDICYGN